MQLTSCRVLLLSCYALTKCQHAACGKEVQDNTCQRSAKLPVPNRHFLSAIVQLLRMSACKTTALQPCWKASDVSSTLDSLVQFKGSNERLHAVAALALALEVLETTFFRRRSAAGGGTGPQKS